MGVFGHAPATVHESPRLIPSRAAAAVPAPSLVPPEIPLTALTHTPEAMPPGLGTIYGPVPPVTPTSDVLPMAVQPVSERRPEERLPERLPEPPWIPTARRSDPPAVTDSLALLSSRALRGLPEAATGFLPTARRSDPWPVQMLQEALRRPERPPEAPPAIFAPTRAPALPSALEADPAVLKARKAEGIPDAALPVWTLEPVVVAAKAPVPELEVPGWLLVARRPEEAIPVPYLPMWPVPTRPARVQQLNVVVVGFRDVRQLSSTDPQVSPVGFREVKLVGFREVQDVFFREVRDLRSHAE